MEAEGSEDLTYSGPDFPEELDEFLAYGVREHNGDFEASNFGLNSRLCIWPKREWERESPEAF